MPSLLHPVRTVAAVGALSLPGLLGLVPSSGAVEAAASAPPPATAAPRAAVTMSVPGRVRDESAVTVRIGWRDRRGEPLRGVVTLQSRPRPGAGWEDRRRVVVRAGRAAVRVEPRSTLGLRVVAPRTATSPRLVSAAHRVVNLPRLRPLTLRGPEPRRRTPEPARAEGVAMNPVVTRIGDRVWRSMVGRSWHPGCPVGRSSLRLVRMNFWGYDGYRRRGELVVNTAIVPQTLALFRRLYRAEHRVRSMYRVDRFGWSPQLQGADDHASMAAGNTSAFNCRYVVGSPGVTSPHATGLAIDVNTWENPYHSARGIVPSPAWDARTRPRKAVYRRSSDLFVRAAHAHGFFWGGQWSGPDWQHVEYDGSGRIGTGRQPGVFLD